MVKITSVSEKLTSLRSKQFYSTLMGDYKEFKRATIDYAKLAVDNFDESLKTKPLTATFPLFSKIGFKMAKVWFLNKLRIKTPEEKTLQKMLQEYKIEQQVSELMNK